MKWILPFVALASAAVSCTSGAPASAEEQANRESLAISFERHEDAQRIDVLADGEKITALHYGDAWDKPFLHPLRTPAGTTVSRGYPVDPQPGEHDDHDWHRGLWYGHGEVNGEDFWREIPERKTDRLEPVEPPETADGDTLRLRLAMKTDEGKVIGHVEKEFRFAVEEGETIIDVTVRLKADEGQALRFGDSDDGGLGLRLAEGFREENGALLRNAAGGRGTDEIWGKQSPWVDYSGEVDGDKAGVSVFDYPQNPRHPTGWHARGYSLVAANPIAAGSFAKDKSVDGSLTIPEGESERFRYRVILYDGQRGDEAIAQRYAEYAGR